MRSPDRIEPFLNELFLFWKKNPDMRFFQLLSTVTLPDEDPFHLEEEEVIERLHIVANPQESYDVKQARMLVNTFLRTKRYQKDFARQKLIDFCVKHLRMRLAAADDWIDDHFPELD